MSGIDRPNQERSAYAAPGRRRRRTVGAPRLLARGWRVAAATTLVTWGALAAAASTPASAATSSTTNHASHAPSHSSKKPAAHSNPHAPAASSAKGFSSSAFASAHPHAANSAGLLSKAPASPFLQSPTVTYTVNTLADDPTGTAANCVSGSETPCTLRDAVAAANAAVEAAVVKVPPGLYQLVFGSISLNNSAGELVEPTTGDASGTVIAVPDLFGSSTDGLPSDPSGPAGAVSTPVVTLSNPSAGATSNYAVDFTTSVAGALAGSSTITVTAPSGTVLPGAVGDYSVTDQGLPFSPTVTSVARSNDGSSAVLTLASPTNLAEVPAGQPLELSVQGVTNPSAISAATLTVATSADTTPVTSAKYSVVAASGEVTIVPGSGSIDNPAAQATGANYSVGFTPATALSGDNGDTITVTLAPGTVLPTDISQYAACSTAPGSSPCTPASSFFTGTPVINGTQVTLTLAPSQGTSGQPGYVAASSAPAGDPVTLTIGGVTNPPLASAAEGASIATSQDTIPTWLNYATTASALDAIFTVDTPSNSGLTQVDDMSLVGAESGGSGYGGAVSQGYSNGPVELDNNNFINDFAGAGGGAYVDGVAYLTGDSFTSDLAWGGGGVYADDGSDVMASNLTFSYDLGYGGLKFFKPSARTSTQHFSKKPSQLSYFGGSGGGGGAVFLGVLNGSGLTATYDEAGYGGGIYLDSYDAQVSNVNASYDYAYDGGGLYDYDYTVSLTNVVADHDTASDAGGGWYEDANTATLASTTLSNGTPFVNDFSNDSADYGGGVYIDDYSDTLANVTANNDTASYDGGGINVDYSNAAKWSNVSASGNSAEYGGGVYVYEVDGTLNWNGGIVGSPVAPTATASCTTKSSNTASDEGGGIYFEYEESYPETMNLSGLTVDGNSAYYYGGGISVEEYYIGLSIANSQISGNAACGDGEGYGGGIYGEYTVGTLTNTTVDYNYADYDGGGIYEYADGDNYGSLDMTGGSLSNDQAPYDGGGGLYTYGPATLTGVTVDHDTAEYAGGIYNDGGSLLVSGGSLNHDTANYSSSGWGGALYNDYVASITGATLADDHATGEPGYDGGGAIYSEGDQLTLTNDTLSGDTADWGGALYNDSGVAHITGSTLNGNTAIGTAESNGGGGALYNYGSATLVNDTLSGNSVTTGSGGALYNDSDAWASLTEVTIAGNKASEGAGAIDAESGATTTIGYSILDGDTAAGALQECAGPGLPAASGGYNVVSDTSCGLQAQGDQAGVNANPAALANNGGPTETMALLSGSPAIDVKVAANCPTGTDQRGDPRPSSANGVTGCDAGAFQGDVLPPPPPPPPVTPAEGYRMVAGDGGVFNFGAAKPYGSLGGVKLVKPIVGMASTPDNKGYWLVASDGGIFTFGDATFHGSTGGVQLTSPIVGMASTPSGKGYWLVASDGGVFRFGDATFYGSTGGVQLTAPVVGMAPTSTGKGYWLVASDGGIFRFGDAKFYGSTGGVKLVKPIVGMTTSADGKGYRLVASDGGLFSFGDAKFYGSTGGVKLVKPIVSMATTYDGKGYWLFASDGGVFRFGDAKFLGSTGGVALVQPMVYGTSA